MSSGPSVAQRLGRVLEKVTESSRLARTPAYGSLLLGKATESPGRRHVRIQVILPSGGKVKSILYLIQTQLLNIMSFFLCLIFLEQHYTLSEKSTSMLIHFPHEPQTLLYIIHCYSSWISNLAINIWQQLFLSAISCKMISVCVLLYIALLIAYTSVANSVTKAFPILLSKYIFSFWFILQTINCLANSRCKESLIVFWSPTYV